MFRANLSAKYMSDYNTGSDLHPSKRQGDTTIVNGRIGLGDAKNVWNVELWANNLFDEDYLQVGFNGPFQVDENNDSISVYNAFLGAPRTVGVTLRTSYEAASGWRDEGPGQRCSGPSVCCHSRFLAPPRPGEALPARSHPRHCGRKENPDPGSSRGRMVSVCLPFR